MNFVVMVLPKSQSKLDKPRKKSEKMSPSWSIWANKQRWVSILGQYASFISYMDDGKTIDVEAHIEDFLKLLFKKVTRHSKSQLSGQKLHKS